jgi:hypothetical protein
MASLRSSRGHWQLHVKDDPFVHACQGFFYTAAIPSAAASFAAARSSLLLPTTPCEVCFRRGLAFPINLSIIRSCVVIGVRGAAAGYRHQAGHASVTEGMLLSRENGRLISTIRRLSSHPVFEWFRE